MLYNIILSLSKKKESGEHAFCHPPHATSPLLQLQLWHPACISGVRALGECDNCQNGCVMFALYFEAAAAPGLPKLEEEHEQQG